MSEKAPTGQAALEAERKRIAEQRAAVDLEDQLLNQAEAFGKFDENVTPVDGEVTYNDYLESRPRELVDVNGAIRDAESGKFGGTEAFKQQNETQQDYYDRVGGLVNGEGEFEKPDYEAMGVMQLAKEASKARLLGDVAGEKEVIEAAHNHLTMEAMSDDTESSEKAQARFESELARFEDLVDRMEGGARAIDAVDSAGTTGSSKAAAGGPEAVSGVGIAGSSVEAPADGAEAGVTEATEVSAEVVKPLIVEVEYKGEKYALGDVFVSPSGEKIVKIYGAGGESLYVSEGDIAEVPVEAAEATEATGSDSAEATVNPVEAEPEEGVRQPSKELVLYGSENSGHSQELVPYETLSEEVETESKESAWGRVKNWFKKERGNFQKFGGRAYFAEKWERAKRTGTEAKDNVLNFGIVEADDEGERERKRKRNRVAIIAGGALLGAAALYTGIQIFSGEEAQGANEAMNNGASGAGVDLGPAGNADLNIPGSESNISQELKETLNNTEATGAGTEITNAAAEVYSQPVDIWRGMGGEALFQQMGFDNLDWYSHENNLLQMFPDDFYRMEDGHVGLAYPGQLAPDVQQYIESLR